MAWRVVNGVACLRHASSERTWARSLFFDNLASKVQLSVSVTFLETPLRVPLILCKLLSLHLLGTYQDDDSILIHHLVAGQSHPFEVLFQVPCSTIKSAASQIMWFLSQGNSCITFFFKLVKPQVLGGMRKIS